MRDVLLSASLNWRQIAAVAEGARLELAPEVRDRIVKARGIVDALRRGVKGYGINIASARCAT